MDIDRKKHVPEITAEAAAKVTAGIFGAISAAIHVSLLSAKVATTAAKTIASVGKVAEILATDIAKNVVEAETTVNTRIGNHIHIERKGGKCL